MKTSNSVLQKNKGRRGRPPTGRNDEDYAPVRSFRLGDDIMARIDAWSAAQGDTPGRSETIRRLVELGLTVAPRHRGAHKGAAKAKAMAGEQIDRMADEATSPGERQSRKGQLLKGPSEFREMRTDLPKPKPGR
jgi:hypothetical protein